MKRGIAFLTVLFLILSGTLTVFAQPRRVFDQADLLTSQEEAQLEDSIAELEKKMRADVVCVTTADKQGKSLREYADDFYDQGSFGQGKKKDGVLFLLDMEERTVYLSTSGKMIYYLTDERIDYVVENDEVLWNELLAGHWAAGIQRALDDIYAWYQKGIPGGQYTYNEETGEIVRHRSLKFWEILVSVLLAGIPSFLYVRNVNAEYKMKQEKKQAQASRLAYRMASVFAFAAVGDELLGRTTTQRVLPRVQSGGSGGSGQSTIHTSGGGMTHGGGGGGRHF